MNSRSLTTVNETLLIVGFVVILVMLSEPSFVSFWYLLDFVADHTLVLSLALLAG